MLGSKRTTIVLLILVSMFGIINLDRDTVGNVVVSFDIEEKNFAIEDGVINLNSLTLKQKIGQMIFTLGKLENKELYHDMNIGGLYFWQKESEDVYSSEIKQFQENMEIPFFIGVDLEGCWNPFENFTHFPSFKEIKDEREAYDLGMEQGKLLRKLGFNINFSPVVDREDTIWKCRTFNGSVISKSVNYIKGLQSQGIIATAKHYPGKTLVGKDPHKFVEFSIIDEEDLKPFDAAVKNGVKSVMINHLITKGEVDSGQSPSVVSGKVIDTIKKNYDGLILTDEVRMAGLKDMYDDETRMYIDLVNAGNDVILDFKAEPWHLNRIINIIEKGVKTKEISEDTIDNAVIKILKMKGFKVKRKL
jgi:beta-N-acetylhexosaminidase